MGRKKLAANGLFFFWIFANLSVVSPTVMKRNKAVVCVDFDAKSCEDKERSNCTYRNVTCNAGVEHCMAVFRPVPNRQFNFIFLKCWPEWERKGCPTQENACLQVHSAERNLAHCCCKGDLCNDPTHLKYVKRNSSSEKKRKVTEKPPDIKRKRQNGVMYNAMIILIPLVVFCVVIIFGYWLCRRYYCCRPLIYKQRHNLLPTQSGMTGGITDQTSLLASGAVGPDGYKPGTLIELCSLIEIRSRGRYGCVWLSKMRGWPYKKDDTEEREVAVKVFPPQDRQSWLTEQEIYRLRGLQHPSILKYIGSDQCGENVHAQLWIVTEYHPVGSVADFLRANTVEYPQLLSILRSIAEGMRHLHEELIPNKPSIAHRDFKSKNVLLKANLREACIADMGLALKFEMGQRVGDTHAQVGTRRYMAPEVLEGAIQFSRDAFLRIDTYAMALVMWELMTRCNFLEQPQRRQNGPGVANVRREEEEGEGAEGNEEEEETDEGLAMLEDDSSHRSTPSHSPGGFGGGRFGGVDTTGATTVYHLPFELELGSQPSLEAMQEFVVQRKLRPKMNPEWQQHPGMMRMWETLEECWDQDAEARLSAGLVMVRLEGLEAQLPPERRLPPLRGAISRHNAPRRRRDSSSSALGSSASSLHPAANAQLA